MKTALVTGGAGFLGSHLTDLLLTRGWKVIAVDNCVTGGWRNLEHVGQGDQLIRLEQDVVEPFQVEDDVDWVFHFASPASPEDFTRIPFEVLDVNSVGTKNLLELALAKKARFMFASTSEVYGDPHVSPQPETYWGNVNPNGIRSVYDESKRFGEAMTMAYRRYRGADVRIVRFFNTYGPRMRIDDGRAVPNFIAQALRGEPITLYGDGTQTRSFGYVEDVVGGVYRLMESAVTTPVNIGNDGEYTIRELAEAIIRLTGAKSEIVERDALPDDPKQRRPDLSEARRHLGYEPVTPLEEGLKKTIEFYRSEINVG